MLPFLMATIQQPQVSMAGRALRWIILAIGCLMAVKSGFKRAGEKRRLVTSADKTIIAFLSLFFLSEIWTIQPWFTVQRAASMTLLYGCSFWTLWEYADHFSEKQLIRKILQTLGIVLALNFAALIITPNSAWFAGRFRGFFVNPNNIGLTLSVAMPLALAQLIKDRTTWLFILVAVFSASLLACGSRSPILGTGIATIAILISFSAKKSSQVIAIAVLSCIGLTFFIQTDLFTEHVLREDSLYQASNRTFFWELGREYIAKRPDFGHGFGTDTLIHDHYGIALVDLALRGDGVMSSYYGLAVQIGRPLAYCFFGAIWGFVFYSFMKYWEDYELVTLLGSIASGLVLCFFENSIYSAGNNFCFVFWMVFMLAVRRILYRKFGLSAQT